jgi:hypothetical protein
MQGDIMTLPHISSNYFCVGSKHYSQPIIPQKINIVNKLTNINDLYGNSKM